MKCIEYGEYINSDLDKFLNWKIIKLKKRLVIFEFINFD